MSNRFWEIDSLRGIAVILMVIFNYSFALKFLKFYAVAEDTNFLYWRVFPWAIASVFIFLAGASLYINVQKNKTIKTAIMHGFKILLCGFGITIVTWLFYPSYTIYFGILHLIGFGIILAAPIVNFRFNSILGAIIVASGVFLQHFVFSFPWLLWLGFVPKSFTTFDYFPMLPWFGVMLLGTSIGQVFYKKGIRTFKIVELNSLPLIKQLCWAGRNSLMIYLVHQPVLIGVLYFLGIPIF